MLILVRGLAAGWVAGIKLIGAGARPFPLRELSFAILLPSRHPLETKKKGYSVRKGIILQSTSAEPGTAVSIQVKKKRQHCTLRAPESQSKDARRHACQAQKKIKNVRCQECRAECSTRKKKQASILNSFGVIQGKIRANLVCLSKG